MFKFDFSKTPEELNSDSTIAIDEILQSEEIIQDAEATEVIIASAKEEDKIQNFENYDILYISPNFSLSGASKSGDKHIIDAENAHSDLIPGKYEGGLKLWEGTADLANYLNESYCKDKSVLDLGCGIGLLGILSKKLGSKQVTFQDYNSMVLKYSTIPNVKLNHLDLCNFYSGDWESFSKLIGTVKFDLILTSETIYNVSNYAKLCNIFKNHLQPNGVILLAAKSCYFGVGGGTLKFIEYLKENINFKYEIVWQFSDGVKRDILKITIS